jgi:predicted nucleic acid-binding protein
LDFDQRVISIDADIGRVAGRMEDAAIAVGRNPGLADILIAATAHAHDLLVLTANARHFAVLGIPNMDPFSEELPD